MTADSFRDFVLELLAPLNGLLCKCMFGGYGLYHGEQFFGHNAAVFAPSEKQVLKNYREVPVDILEDSEGLLLWAKKAAQQ